MEHDHFFSQCESHWLSKLLTVFRFDWAMTQKSSPKYFNYFRKLCITAAAAAIKVELAEWTESFSPLPA